MMSLMLDTPYHFHTPFKLFSKHLQHVYTKSKFKYSRKYIGAFEEHADDVTFGGPILPKIGEFVQN